MTQWAREDPKWLQYHVTTKNDMYKIGTCNKKTTKHNMYMIAMTDAAKQLQNTSNMTQKPYQDYPKKKPERHQKRIAAIAVIAAKKYHMRCERVCSVHWECAIQHCSWNDDSLVEIHVICWIHFIITQDSDVIALEFTVPTPPNNTPPPFSKSLTIPWHVLLIQLRHTYKYTIFQNDLKTSFHISLFQFWSYFIPSHPLHQNPKIAQSNLA